MASSVCWLFLLFAALAARETLGFHLYPFLEHRSRPRWYVSLPDKKICARTEGS